jgi:serine/threonine-protein kinase
MRVGNYLLMGPLGEGGMGQVYRGEHVVIKKEVAIKVLRPHLAREKQVVERFLMEARAVAMIRHNNIVDVTDFGELPDGCSFFVMEFLDGPNLADVIAREDRLPLYRAVNILTQVCQALDACHGKGIAHRDLKPENIVLLRRDGRRELVTVPQVPQTEPAVRREGFYDEVKILDFGIAKIQLMTAALDHETTRKGIVFGSPYYLSPEQAQGEPGDHRSDIYALGIIFYEMLTGEIPFDGDTPHEIMVKHVREPMPSMRARRPDLDLPPEADLLVSRATAKKPQDRHRSAAAFLEDLRHCFGDVIFGRDIDRFLKVRRRRTILKWQPPPDEDGLERRLTPRQIQINSELEGLFNKDYEQARPVTESTLNEIRAAPGPRDRRADQDAVRAELDDLFNGEEE